MWHRALFEATSLFSTSSIPSAGALEGVMAALMLYDSDGEVIEVVDL